MSQQFPPAPPPGQRPGYLPGEPPRYAAYPPQPAYAPPSPPPKKPLTQRWWFWVIIGFFGLGLLGRCSAPTSSTSGSAPTATASARSTAQETTPPTAAAASAPASVTPVAPPPPPPPSKSPEPAGLNTPVTDRDLEFTVTGFACGVTVKDPFQTLQPQGKFCRIKLTAKNVGTRQTTLSDQQITLEDASGAKYSASSETWMVEGSMFLKAINPGNTLTGVVIIDVPTQVTPTAARLSAGTFSRGVRVALPSA